MLSRGLGHTVRLSNVLNRSGLTETEPVSIPDDLMHSFKT
jgi:hypothetical protein